MAARTRAKHARQHPRALNHRAYRESLSTRVRNPQARVRGQLTTQIRADVALATLRMHAHLSGGPGDRAADDTCHSELENRPMHRPAGPRPGPGKAICSRCGPWKSSPARHGRRQLGVRGAWGLGGQELRHTVERAQARRKQLRMAATETSNGKLGHYEANMLKARGTIST